MKELYELELLYSYVYILSPSPRCPQTSVHAQRLIFEHCVAYASKMLALITQPNQESLPLLSFYDAMRSYMTGRQFVDMLSRNLNKLLDLPAPTPPSNVTPNSIYESEPDPMSSAECQQPPIPHPRADSAGNDPISRAISAINNYTAILAALGNRFGYISWRDRFQKESAPLLGQLFQRLQDRHRRSQQSSLGDWVNEMNNNDTNHTGWQHTGAEQPVTYPAVSMYDSDNAPSLNSFNWQAANGLGMTDYNISPGSSVVHPPTSVSRSIDDFELGGWTAIETLPGGYLNARFS